MTLQTNCTTINLRDFNQICNSASISGDIFVGSWRGGLVETCDVRHRNVPVGWSIGLRARLHFYDGATSFDRSCRILLFWTYCPGVIPRKRLKRWVRWL